MEWNQDMFAWYGNIFLLSKQIKAVFSDIMFMIIKIMALPDCLHGSENSLQMIIIGLCFVCTCGVLLERWTLRNCSSDSVNGVTEGHCSPCGWQRVDPFVCYVQGWCQDRTAAANGGQTHKRAKRKHSLHSSLVLPHKLISLWAV